MVASRARFRSFSGQRAGRQASGRTEAARRSVAAKGKRDRAESHRKTRQDRSVELAQDYVEVIAELIEQQGEARLVEIAQRLGVTHVTVSRTLTRLQRQGLVERQRYRSIFLTQSGKELAEMARYRHSIVLDFLLALGIERSVAENDAEGIEHHVSDQTLQAFRTHVQKSACSVRGRGSR